MPDPKQKSVQLQDLLFRGVARFFAFLVLAILLGIIVSLVYGSLPAIQKFGFGFLVSSEWNPVTEKFGALVPIVGTLVTSVIALLIGVPVSFGIALFLTELSPPWLKRPLGTAIELLAAIPSIIYGMWGLFVFAPLFADYVQPWLINTLGAMPLIGALFKGPPQGIGVLHRRVHPGDHGDPVHRIGDARRVRDRAADAEGIRLRHRLHDLGSRLEHRAALHQGRRDRRHHAGSGPRAGRDHGGDLRHRQRAPADRVDPRSPATASPRRSPTNSPRRSATSTRRR